MAVSDRVEVGISKYHIVMSWLLEIRKAQRITRYVAVILTGKCIFQIASNLVPIEPPGPCCVEDN